MCAILLNRPKKPLSTGKAAPRRDNIPSDAKSIPLRNRPSRGFVPVFSQTEGTYRLTSALRYATLFLLWLCCQR